MNKLRFVAKALIHGAIDWSGLPYRQRRLLGGSLIILTYHSFCAEWPQGLFNSLPVARFERQLRFLRANFKLVSLQQGLRCVQQGHIEEQPRVAITIDDGFRDNYTNAWPILQRYGVPATIFVTTDFIDTGRPPWPTQLVEILERTEVKVMEAPFRSDLKSLAERSAAALQLKNAWSALPPEERFKRLVRLRRHLQVDVDTRYPSLTWDQVREMRKAGIHFGSHTEYHSMLTRVARGVAESELRIAKWRLESELDEPCDVLAYPGGEHNGVTANLVRTVGYKAALTQEPGANDDVADLYHLRRVEVPYHDPLATFRVRVSLAV